MLHFLKVPSAKLRRAAVIASLMLAAGCGSAEQRAQDHYDRGMKLLAQGDHARAGLELKNALRIKEGNAAAWRALAQVEEHNQNWQAVVAALRTAIRHDSKDLETRVKLARFMLLGNALDEALKLVDGALELNDRHTGALVLKAAVLLRLDDGNGAVREARKVLEIEPGNSEALIVLAAERAAAGDTKAALTILDREVSGGRPNTGIQLFKAQLFERMGDLKQVEALLRKLIDLDPKEAQFRRFLVRLYASQKRLDEAEKELRSLAAGDASNAEAGLEVVRFLNAMRGPDAAKNELLARINAGGNVFPYQIALAEFHFARRDTDEAIQVLQSLINSAATPQNVVAAQGKLAELYVLIKKTEAAEALISDILRKDSRNITALKLRALVRINRGELAAAIADLRQALNDQPRAADIMLLLALAYERSGSIELAENQYVGAARASSSDPGAALTYVQFLQRRGNPTRAEDVLSDLAVQFPNSVQVLSALAAVKLSSRDWIGAEEVAKRLRSLGLSTVADQVLGEALGGRNRLDQSIDVLRTAYAEAPNAVQSMSALVRAYVRAKQTDRAIGFLQDVLKSSPDNAEALVLLGSLTLAGGARDEAVKHFRTAIERQPTNVVGYRALVNLYLDQNNLDEALAVIRAGLKHVPENYPLRMALAGVFELKKDYAAAIAEYEALFKEQPGSLVIANNLASLLTDHGTDKASFERAYVVAAVLQRTQVPHFKDTLGWVYYLRGEYRNALPLLEQAAAELPNNALVLYHLGATFVAMGENARAAELLQKALNLASNDSALQEKVRAMLKQTG